MTSLLVAIIVAILAYCSGLAGLHLQKRVPEEHMTGGSRDMILAVIGLLTLLLALVLGTIVGNSYAYFATQKFELEAFASHALLLDQALADYGPDAKPTRDRLKETLTQSYHLFWGADDADPERFGVDVAMARWKPMNEALKALNPSTEAQKREVSAAIVVFGQMEQTRMLMSLQLASPIAPMFVVIVVAWSMFLFCGFGVLSGANRTTRATLALGAISVGSAIFLIQDLSEPFSGLFRVPPGSIVQTIEAIDR
jgi:hypothetical protein